MTALGFIFIGLALLCIYAHFGIAAAFCIIASLLCFEISDQAPKF